MLQAKHVECNDFSEHWQTHMSNTGDGQNHENESKLGQSRSTNPKSQESKNKIERKHQATWYKLTTSVGSKPGREGSQTTGESNQGGADGVEGTETGKWKETNRKGTFKIKQETNTNTGNDPLSWKNDTSHGCTDTTPWAQEQIILKHPDRSGCINKCSTEMIYKFVPWNYETVHSMSNSHTSQRYSSCLLIISTNCKNIAVMCLVVLCIFSFIPSCKERICPSSLQSGDLIWWKELQYLVKKQGGDFNLFSNFLNLISSVLSAWAGVQTGNGRIHQKFVQTWRWNAGMELERFATASASLVAVD